uniref:Uncharacterized protein n=1 Tax=Daphnia galeata TaxID=27404 RepID=A0A8J2RM16_9CRUS|nr:unnamed protein product [Daphnia galeata]
MRFVYLLMVCVWLLAVVTMASEQVGRVRRQNGPVFTNSFRRPLRRPPVATVRVSSVKKYEHEPLDHHHHLYHS